MIYNTPLWNFIVFAFNHDPLRTKPARTPKQTAIMRKSKVFGKVEHAAHGRRDKLGRSPASAQTSDFGQAVRRPDLSACLFSFPICFKPSTLARPRDYRRSSARNMDGFTRFDRPAVGNLYGHSRRRMHDLDPSHRLGRPPGFARLQSPPPPHPAPFQVFIFSLLSFLATLHAFLIHIS